MTRQITVQEKLAEIVREIAMRRSVYPFRVKTKVMRQEEADRRIVVMVAIAQDYEDAIDAIDAAEADKELKEIGT